MIATLIQPGHSWIDVVLTTILMLPGIIAAASSLKNGKELKKKPNYKDLRVEPHKGGTKADHRDRRDPGVASNPDWYKPPDFD